MASEFDYTKAQLEDWDFVVLFVYFASILAVGIWVSYYGVRTCEHCVVVKAS